ncbi:hypothetical protein EDC01DRAFT_732748 [Geopyxis carbonaria]|nr:hypothetical protein EDC01DRAFT_732748 [Geopyxis carbonaria]
MSRLNEQSKEVFADALMAAHLRPHRRLKRSEAGCALRQALSPVAARPPHIPSLFRFPSFSPHPSSLTTAPVANDPSRVLYRCPTAPPAPSSRADGDPPPRLKTGSLPPPQSCSAGNHQAPLNNNYIGTNPFDFFDFNSASDVLIDDFLLYPGELEPAPPSLARDADVSSSTSNSSLTSTPFDASPLDAFLLPTPSTSFDPSTIEPLDTFLQAFGLPAPPAAITTPLPTPSASSGASAPASPAPTPPPPSRKRKAPSQTPDADSSALPPIEIAPNDDPVSVKRKRNTVAARRYRQKKMDRMNELELELEEMRAEKERWREEAMRKGLEAEKWKAVVDVLRNGGRPE